MIRVELKIEKILDSEKTCEKQVELDKYLGTLPTAYCVWPQAVFTGFVLEGHARQAAYGHDIICAATTNQAATCISALMDIAKIANLAYSLDSGKITCKLPNSKQLNETQLLLSQVIFAQFYLGLEQIACSEQAKNGDYIEVIAPKLERKR